MVVPMTAFNDATIPAELKALPQWICWKPEQVGERVTKVPYAPATGYKASSTDPETWSDYVTAATAAMQVNCGIGYVFTREAGIVGIDLDHCRDADTGIIDPWALEIIGNLDSYAEVSPSGTGVHLLMRGQLPFAGRKRGLVEAYQHGRYFTVTGEHLKGTPSTIEERQDALREFCQAQWPDPEPRSASPNGRAAAALSDDAIVEKCRSARNGAKFDALWQGDWTGYPSQSDADLALLGILKFYSQDRAQLDRLFRASGLMRDKWDERRGVDTYGTLTIIKALQDVRETYAPASASRSSAPAILEESEEASPAPWPKLDDSALYGLPGEFVKSVEPYSEADPTGILLHLLIGAGVMIGPQPHVLVEHMPHCARTNIILVGTTAGGRKGTAWSPVRYVLRQIDESFVLTRVKSGLSSGEGLIYQVRDPQYSQEAIREGGRRTGEIIGYQDVLTDPGEPDKRLLIIESEFSSALTVMEREGNTLSPVLRDVWDHGNLSPLTKRERISAIGAHAAIIGHITEYELLRKLTATDRANGVANRFLFALVRQSKFIPSGKGTPEEVLRPYLMRFVRTLERARTREQLFRDPECEQLWTSVYQNLGLSEGAQGLTGAILARGAAQVLRLSLLYALLDEEETQRTDTAIRVPHLLAALAIWDYCTASTYQIFGDAIGDPLADRFLRLIKTGPQTDTDLYESMGKHDGDRNRKGAALDLLQRLRRIHPKKIMTTGRAQTEWHVGVSLGCALCAQRG